MNKNKTRDLIRIALFAALTAVLSQIFIPLPFTPVPVNLATFSIFIAGGVLGAKNGAISQIVYLLIGAIGLPVFAGFTAGLGIVLGPTGGYLLGYILCAFVIGLCIKKWKNNYILAFILGLSACYLLGTLWFMFTTKTPLIPSLTMCVIPFIPGDIVKILGACLVTKRIKNALG